jgi:hypothetical protein
MDKKGFHKDLKNKILNGYNSSNQLKKTESKRTNSGFPRVLHVLQTPSRSLRSFALENSDNSKSLVKNSLEININSSRNNNLNSIYYDQSQSPYLKSYAHEISKDFSQNHIEFSKTISETSRNPYGAYFSSATSRNFKSETLQNLGNLSSKLIFDTEVISNLLRKSDEDQNIIIWHNLVMTKKKFNFEEINRNNEKSDNSFKFIFNSFNPKNISSDDPIFKFFDTLKKHNINPFKEKSFTTDSYREILKKKILFENERKKELNTISSDLVYLKLTKKKLIDEKKKIALKITNLRDEYNLTKLIIDKEKKEIENIFIESIENLKGKTEQFYKENRIILKNDSENKLKEELRKCIKVKDGDIYRLEEEFVGKNEKLKKVLTNLDNQMIDNSDTIKNKRIFLLSKIEEMKIYYLQILVKGLDVRSEGLVWVTKKLLELNHSIETTNFPEFLDNNQVNYIIKIAQLKNEITNLNVLYKILKKRERNSQHSPSKNIIKRNSTNFLNNLPKELKQIFSTKITKNLGESLIWYQHLLNLGNQEKSLEDLNIKKMIFELKTKIRSHKFIQEKESHESAIDENYEELIKIKRIIASNEEEIESLKKQEQKNFIKKYEGCKLINPIQMVNYDIIKAALFGNGVL